MPTRSDRCIVLSRTKLGESDLILTLLSEDGSQVRAVAKGARKPRSKIGGTVESFSVIDVLLARGKSLDIVGEASSLFTNAACRVDLEHSCAASLVCESCRKLTLPGQEQPRLFDMTATCLNSIGQADPTHARLLAAAYILKVTSLLGYRPELAECVFCGQSVSASEDGSILFSLCHGGVVCGGCFERNSDAIGYPADLIGWLATLIGSRFEELSRCECTDELVSDLLRFCELWLAEHVDIRLKSMSFMFTRL